MKKRNTQKTNRPGFLMTEAAIAIFITGMVLITFFNVLSRMYLNVYTQRDYIIAENLAQEGVEMVRNLRDNNLKSGKEAFFGGNPFACSKTSGNNCDCTSGCSLGSDFSSKFNRTVNVAYNDSNSRIVTSTVKWTLPGGGGEKEAEVKATLYDWGDKQ